MRRHWLAIAIPALLALSLVALLVVTPASADDARVVGAYRITASFERTPVYPLEANALLVRVVSESGAPVAGVDSSLRLRIGVPNQVTETWELTSVPGQPGVYKVLLTLPRAGSYNITLFGNLNGQQVSERFVTGQNGLDKVIAPPRSYPRGSGIVVLVTLVGYLVGVAYLTARAALGRYRRAHRPAA